MSRYRRLSRQGLSLALTLIVVLSVIAGPVSASAGTATGEAQLGGPPANQLDTVDDDQLTQASENISVWDGAFLSLRPDDTDSRLDSAAAYQVQSTNTYVRVDGRERSLEKNPMYVYNVGQEVPFTFSGSSAGAPRAIEGQDVQLVAAKLDKGATIPRSVPGIAQTLTSDDDVSSSVVGSAQGTSDDNSFAFTPDESGMWMFAVVTVDDGTGFSDANGDGNLETDGNVTFVGVDALPVQQGSSSVSAPSLAGNGQNVTVTVDASSLDATEVSHTVAIFNESDLSNYDQTINATDRSSISLETEIARVNGTSRMPSNANIMGVTPGSRSFVGSETAVSIFDQLNDSTSRFDDVTVVSPGATVYGSAVTEVAGNQTTVEVPIADDATPGDYVVMHVATNQSGTESVTNRAPLQVAQSVQLNLTANTTTPVAGEDVEFAVTREDTGAAVENAEVTVGGTTVQTNANGVAVVTVPTAGEYNATVSKNATNGEAFAGDALALDVFEPATFEYSNLTIEPKQVVPGTDVVANATVENVGEVNGSYEAALTVDGEPQPSSDTGELQPNESTEVSFTTSFEDPGTYNVSIDELSTDDAELVSRTVRVIAPANSTVTDVTVEPTSVNTTERYTTSATVENTGGRSDLVRLTYTTTDDSGTEVSNTTRTVVVGADSTVTRNVTTLAPTALGADDVGNFTVAVNGVEADSTLTVTRRDRLPPTVRLPEPAQGAVPFGTPITLNVSDESDVRRATYSFGNGSQPLSLDANGSATVPTGDLDEGETTLTVNATDTAGNTITRTFSFDFVSSPRVTSVEPTDVVGPSSTISASFADDRNGDAESGINASATTLVVNGTAVDLSGATTNDNSTLEINVSELGVSLDEGPTTARLTVVDEAGHATSRLFEFEYDETAPTASLTLDPDYDEDREDVSANNPVDITLDSADDNLESAAFVVRDSDDEAVYTRDVTSLASSTGEFEIEWDGTSDDSSLVDSCSYNLTLVSTDAGGNTGVANATVCVDNDEPTYDVSAVDGTTDPVYTNGSVDVAYSTSESVTVEYAFESDSGVTATFERTPDNGTGNHTLDVASALPDGNYTMTATATDLGNNQVTVERADPVVVDTTDPGLTATLNTTESGTLSVSVASTEPLAGTPDAELTDPNSNVESLNLTEQDSTTWTAELDTTESGEYALDVTGTDRAGNTASDSSTATVTSNNFSEQSSVLLVSASGDTFIRINASDDADLPAGQTVITLTDTNVPPNALSQGTAATKYLEANAGLTEDQIESVTYGFNEDLDTSGNGFNIVYIERGGTQVLPTTLQTDPFGLSGNYYTATRTGLSTYGAVENDTEAPTISYDDPTEGAEFSEVNDTVSVNATLSDNVEVNTSSVSVTLDSDGPVSNVDVTDNATVTNESVNYTASGLSPADYTVTIEASDTNLTANTATEQVNFTVQDDREPPTITALGPTNGTTFPFGTDTVELNATYEEASDAVNDTGVDAENVTVLYDGQDISASAAPDATGFNTTVSVDGNETHNLTVRVLDNAGNSVEDTTNFSIAADDAEPTVEISSPVEDEELSNTTSSVNVTASVDDAESGVNLSSVTVTFDGTDVTSEATLDDLSNIRLNETGLEPGTSHTVSVSAADESGNENASTVNFTVAPDLTAPNVTRVSSQNATFESDANVSVEVNYSDPESGIDASAVTLLLDGEDVTDDATVFSNPGATLDLNSSEIDSGEHLLSVRVTNNNGDTTTNDTTFSVNQGPDIAVTAADLNATSVQTGDQVEVTAQVENFGDETGSLDIGVTGTSQAGTTDFGVTKSVTLDTGENQSVSLVIEPTSAGTYSIAVDETTTENALDVSSPTADIQLLGDSSASPSTLLEDEETTVTVKLGNLGGASGNISGDVTRNGTTVGNVSTSLASGAQRTFTFTDTPPGTGDYVYAFGGETIETVSVSARLPAFSIDAGASSISQSTVDTEETFTVSVRVNNTGTAEGTYTKALTADGTTLATESVTVGPGSSGTLTYTVSIDDAGTYDLQVDNVTVGSITVEEPNVGGGGGAGGSSLPHDATTDSDRLFSARGFDAQFDGGQGVSAVSITFSEQTTGEVVVSERSGVPGSVGQPDGTAVSYVRIDVPDSARDRASTLRFTVKQSRLDELGIESSDLVVRRFNEDAGSWEDLETSVVDSGNGAVVLEADTPGFSYFAVTSRQAVTTTTPDDDDGTTTTPDDGDGTDTTTSTAGFDDETSTAASDTTDSPVPGFGAALAVVALLAAALLAVRRND